MNSRRDWGQYLTHTTLFGWLLNEAFSLPVCKSQILAVRSLLLVNKRSSVASRDSTALVWPSAVCVQTTGAALLGGTFPVLGTICPLFGGCNVGGCVLLVNLENTLSSVGRSRVRRDRVGEEGGVASDEVASTELERDMRLEVLLFLRLNTGDGSGLGLLYSFLWNRGEGPGSGRGGFWAASTPILDRLEEEDIFIIPVVLGGGII